MASRFHSNLNQSALSFAKKESWNRTPNGIGLKYLLNLQLALETILQKLRKDSMKSLRLWYVALTRSKKYLFISGIECTRTHTSQFASNIQHDYVCTDPQTVFPRPNRIAPSVPIDATILPTNFSDLRYYWDCPKDYLLRRLMGFSPGVNESYGYGQQIHNLLALS